MDQAHHGRSPTLEQSLGRPAVRLVLLHDHWFPRPACIGRGHLSVSDRAPGLARVLRPEGKLRNGGDHGSVLALRRSRVGIHLRILLSVVGVAHMATTAGHMETTTGHAQVAAAHPKGEGQQHPLTIYLWIWALLFVFSTF